MRIRRVATMVTVGTAIAASAIVASAGASDAHREIARAKLIDGTGSPVGYAVFIRGRDGDVVGSMHVRLPADSPEFHGFHVHANADGTGCVAGSGFTGVGGHWDVGGHTHGSHTGDLPSVVRTSDGTADIVFHLDKFRASDLLGKALIVHAGPDNFGNVPLGPAANQYTDNGTAYNGTGGTAFTGNAGARFACGVVTATG